MKKARILSLLCLVAFFSLAAVSFAFPAVCTEPVRAISDGVAPWAKVECLKDDSAGFVAEKFHSKSKRSYEILKNAFGSDEPHSNLVLLHYGPNWNENNGKTPVLLVHGAGDNASRAWCHPYEFEVKPGAEISKPGIMQYLVSKGYPVFAVTFSHPHGDNFLQAQQLANAIARIKEVRGGGDGFKVDLVCHSKGAMAVRIYLSSLGDNYPKYRWLTKFRGDVAKTVFIASPLRGIDTAYRYYAYNLTVVSKDMAAPVGATGMLYLGSWVDFEKYNEMFPGQPQMLFNWADNGIGFNLQSATPDAGNTAFVLYRGGASTLLFGNGIRADMKKAGSVINMLNDKGVAPSVRCYVMAGTKQDIDHITIGVFKIPVGEMADSSDGVLFEKSATFTSGLTKRGAKVEMMKLFDTHHVGLTVRPDCLEFIDKALSHEFTESQKAANCR